MRADSQSATRRTVFVAAAIAAAVAAVLLACYLLSFPAASRSDRAQIRETIKLIRRGGGKSDGRLYCTAFNKLLERSADLGRLPDELTSDRGRITSIVVTGDEATVEIGAQVGPQGGPQIDTATRAESPGESRSIPFTKEDGRWKACPVSPLSPTPAAQ